MPNKYLITILSTSISNNIYITRTNQIHCSSNTLKASKQFTSRNCIIMHSLQVICLSSINAMSMGERRRGRKWGVAEHSEKVWKEIKRKLITERTFYGYINYAHFAFYAIWWEILALFCLSFKNPKFIGFSELHLVSEFEIETNKPTTNGELKSNYIIEIFGKCCTLCKVTERSFRNGIL